MNESSTNHHKDDLVRCNMSRTDKMKENLENIQIQLPGLNDIFASSIRHNFVKLCTKKSLEHFEENISQNLHGSGTKFLLLFSYIVKKIQTKLNFV